MPSRSSATPSHAHALAAIADCLGGWAEGAGRRPDDDARGPGRSRAVALLVRVWPWVRWLQLGVIAGGLVTAALSYLAVTTRNRGLAGLSLVVAVGVLLWIIALLVGAVLSYRLRTAASARYVRGNVALGRAERAAGEERLSLLEEAARAFQEALMICPRAVDSDLWAATHLNLGHALARRADVAADGAERAELLEQAAVVLWQALEAYTPEGAPAEWADTLLALGRALEDQAEGVDGEERTRLLGAAAAAYGATAEVHTRQAAPLAWARTQATIGAVLCKLAALADNSAERARLLGLAVDGLRTAMEVSTRETAPEEWASLQSLLATALRGQAALVWEDAERARLLDEALNAMRQSLGVSTRWVVPEEWAALQNELGMALRERASLAVGDDAERGGLLDEAVTALDAALEVRTREASVAAWAATRRYLAGVLRDRAVLAEDPEQARMLDEAADVYREILRVYAPDGEVPNAAAYAQVRQELTHLTS